MLDHKQMTTRERLEEIIEEVEDGINDACKDLLVTSKKLIELSTAAQTDCQERVAGRPCSLFWIGAIESELNRAKEARERLDRLVEKKKSMKYLLKFEKAAEAEIRQNPAMSPAIEEYVAEVKKKAPGADRWEIINYHHQGFTAEKAAELIANDAATADEYDEFENYLDELLRDQGRSQDLQSKKKTRH